MNLTILIRLGIFAAVLLLIDLYAYQAIRTVFKDSNFMRWSYWIVSASVLLLILYAVVTFSIYGPNNDFLKVLIGVLILTMVPKLILTFFMLSEDIVRVVAGTLSKLTGSNNAEFLPDRRKFISTTAIVLAAVPFAGIIHGISYGRYNFRVIRKQLFFDDLPDAFDGFTITHISDIHSGSFDNREKIRQGVNMINEQNSDLIVFTGDMVNNKAEEMLPWMKEFGSLHAPFGKFSTLGNHDYGDYISWPSTTAKRENLEQLFAIHKELGFNLLRNSSVRIEKEGQHIDLIGVENWGQGFVQYGDLNKATEKLQENSFKVLLSHDPTHFEKVVKNFSKFIHLTLSGHTHGMQFGIEIPGFLKWSPAKYRYPRWAGLYEDQGRKIYINRGFGYLAFPGRVGIWPEITVLELRKNPKT